jgi:mono/diheme cytochrome c family protein
MKEVVDKAIDKGVEALETARKTAESAEKHLSVRMWSGIGALIGALLIGLVAAYLLRDYSVRNLEFMPDMAYSKAWKSQTTHPYARDGAVVPPAIAEWGTADMAPPPGTIYRGQKTLSIGAGDAGREEARGLINPFADLTCPEREAVLQRGKRLFAMNCESCHNVEGAGNARVVRYGVAAPAINDTVVRDKFTDGELFHIITHGINSMAAHASHVEYDDRWKVVLYLRSLQEGS